MLIFYTRVPRCAGADKRKCLRQGMKAIPIEETSQNAEGFRILSARYEDLLFIVGDR